MKFKKIALILLSCVKSIHAFDDQNLAVNTYIAGVVNNNPSVSYRLRSNPSIILESSQENLFGWNSTNSFYVLLNRQSGVVGNTLPQLFFDPVDAVSKEPIPSGSIVITIDPLRNNIIITVEEKFGDSVVIHSKEIVFLPAARFMARQAFLEKNVYNSQGAVMSVIDFDNMRGGSIGLYLVIAHDGTVKVDGGEFSCSSPAQGIFYSLQPNGYSCDSGALLGTTTGRTVLGDVTQETIFRLRCVKSMDHKAIKQYVGGVQ